MDRWSGKAWKVGKYLIWNLEVFIVYTLSGAAARTGYLKKTKKELLQKIERVLHI